MTAGAPVDLHDPATLLAADAAGLLPAAALAGAQVRSVAEQLGVRAGGRDSADRARALVVVGGSAATDVLLLNALLGDQVPAPVLASATLPGWVGALDTVVVLASGVDDVAAAEAAAAADRRGATVLVRAAADGPVASAAGAALFDPAVSVPEALALPARLTLLVLAAARAGLCPAPDPEATAGLLDAMALACHPSSDFFVNPALTLAEHVSGGTALLVGTDAIGDALAAHACRSLATLAGRAGSSLTAAQAAASPSVFAQLAGAPDAGLFYDPYDEPEAAARVRAVIVTGPTPGRAGHALAAALQSAMPRAFHVVDEGAEESVVDADPNAPAPRRARPDDDERPPGPVSPLTAEFTALLAQATRIDFASVYLGLLGGARPPLDAPSGLGRPDRVAAHLRSVGVRSESAWSADPMEPSEGDPGSWS